MMCNKCGCEEWKVTDSRCIGDTIRRRRKCRNCGNRITTYEIEISDIRTAKPDLLRRSMKELIKKFLNEVARKVEIKDEDV